MKNIFIVGAQCTGKTTLANALRDYYSQSLSQEEQPRLIAEVARTAMKKLNIRREEIASSKVQSLRLQKAIMQAQYEAETDSTEKTSRWFISDRSGIDPVVYTDFLLGSGEAEKLMESPIWTTLEANMQMGVVVLCEAGCEWLVDDGTRLMPKSNDEWMHVHDAFCLILKRRSIKYLLVRKEMAQISDRVALVVSAHERAVK